MAEFEVTITEVCPHCNKEFTMDTTVDIEPSNDPSDLD